MAHTARPGRYEEQAATYDLTRGASPTITALLAGQLGPARGRSLLDIAGGTGNYVQAMGSAGLRVTVLDANVQMPARAARKLGRGRAVVGDASALPFADHAFDSAMCVIAVHLFADRRGAFQEARRVVREGPVVVIAYTRENLESLFVQEYFGGWWRGVNGLSAEQVTRELRDAGFADVRAETFVYGDAIGGSLVSMHTDPGRLASEEHLRNLSFWYRYPDAVREAALRRLDADLRSGVLAERVRRSLETAARTGHGTVFNARP